MATLSDPLLGTYPARITDDRGGLSVQATVRRPGKGRASTSPTSGDAKDVAGATGGLTTRINLAGGAADIASAAAALAGQGFFVANHTFTGAETWDLTQFITGWNSSTMQLLLQDSSGVVYAAGATLRAGLTFSGTALVFDGTGGSFTITGLLLFIVPIADDVTPAYAAAMTTYQVLKLTSAVNGKLTLRDAMPPEWVSADGGSVGFMWNMTGAYSGGTYDPDNDTLYAHGGGHAGWLGNHMGQFDFRGTTAPAGMSIIANSYSTPTDAVANAGNDTNGDGRPASVHTYGSICFDPVRRRIHRYGGSKWGSGATPATNWAWDLSAGSWTQVPNTPGTIVNQHCSINDADQHKNLILTHAGDGWFHRLDTDTRGNTVSWFGTNLSNGNPVAAYDTLRKQLIVQSPNSPQLRLVTPNWSAETITDVAITATGATGVLGNAGIGILYDKYRDRYWLLPLGHATTGMTSIYWMDPVTWAITQISPLTGDQTNYCPSGGTEGCFTRLALLFKGSHIGFITDVNVAPFLVKIS